MATKYKAIKVDGIKHDEHRYYIPRDKEFGERALARKYGLGHSSLNRIINKQCYKNVD